MKLILSFLIFGICGVVASATAIQERRPAYERWTSQQVTKILNDSAWAKTQTVRIAPRRQVRTVAGQVSAGPGAGAVPTDGTAALGGAEQAFDYNFTLRLRSALPVRQAIVRLVQLDAKYDEMTPEQKRVLDAQTKELLQCPECVDNYVVSVGFGSQNAPGVNLIYDWFRGHSLASLTGYVYLQNDRGERRELSGFIPPRVPGDEAFFLFPRRDSDGKLLLTPANKRLLFRMSDSVNSVTNFSLDVTKMVVNRRVEF